MNIIHLPDRRQPDEPDWTVVYVDSERQNRAHNYWQEIVSAAGMSAGHVMYRTVIFRIAFDDAHRDVAANGRILKARKTGVPQTNPSWTAMRQAAKILAAHERALGLLSRKRTARPTSQLYP